MINIPKRSALIAAAMALGLTTAATARAEVCQPIKFARGHSSGVVKGVAPSEGVLCYEMRTGNNQNASLRITGRNVIFSVHDLVDAQQSYRFKTEKKTYRIVVGQLFRAVRGEPFTLTVSVK